MASEIHDENNGHNKTSQNVELTETEARQGRKGLQVFIVLMSGLFLAFIVGTALGIIQWSPFSETENNQNSLQLEEPVAPVD